MTRRITLVIHSLQGGGAERIAAAMANHWAEAGDQVTLLTLDDAQHDLYPLADSVSRLGLGLMSESRNALSAVRNNLRRVAALRKQLREARPDVVVSLVVHTNILTLLACRRLSCGVIICEHTDPRQHEIGRSWSWLRRRTYPQCQGLTVLTEGVVPFSRQLVGKRPIYVVPNPLLLEPQPPVPRQPGGPRTVVAMGRLAPAKGFERLIDAFALVAEQHPQWRLRILGEGPERALLEERIAAHQLAGRVELAGWLTDPYQELRQSDLYVLSSRFEGFPVVLLEALACHLPVVSFDCPSGPAEIIRDGVDGLLVAPDDIEQLAAAMDRVMADDDLRAELAAQGAVGVRRFCKELFFRRWESILAGESEQQFRSIK